MTQSLTRRLLIAATVVAALAALAVVYHLGQTTRLGTVGDDGCYLVLGKAIATGAGYRILSEPGQPFNVSYPPAFPAALSVAWLLFPAMPPSPYVFKGVNLLFALAGVLLTYVLAVRGYGLAWWQGLVAAAGVALGKFYLVNVDLTMSEPMFAMTLLAVFLGLERLPDSRHAGKWWMPLAIAALATFPAYVRTIGVSVMAATAAWLFLRGQRKLAVTSALLMGALFAPWYLFCRWAKATGQASWDYVTWTREHIAWNPAELAWTVVDHVRQIGTDSFAAATMPTLFHARVHEALSAVPGLAPAMGALATVAVFAGLTRLSRPRLLLLPCFLAAYYAIVLPFPWEPERYTLVLSPLLVICVVAAIGWPFEALRADPARAARGWQKPVAWGVAIATVVLMMGGYGRLVGLARHGQFHDDLINARERANEADLAACLAWARTALEPDAVWIEVHPYRLWLMDGHQGINYAGGGEPPETLRKLFRERPVYLRISPTYREYQTTHKALLLAHPEKFTLVWDPPDDGVKVYRASRDWP